MEKHQALIIWKWIRERIRLKLDSFLCSCCSSKKTVMVKVVVMVVMDQLWETIKRTKGKQNFYTESNSLERVSLLFLCFFLFRFPQTKFKISFQTLFHHKITILTQLSGEDIENGAVRLKEFLYSFDSVQLSAVERCNWSET